MKNRQVRYLLRRVSQDTAISVKMYRGGRTAKA